LAKECIGQGAHATAVCALRNAGRTRDRSVRVAEAVPRVRERALGALLLDAEVPELARTVELARRPHQRRVDRVDGKQSVYARGVDLREGTRIARLVPRGVHVARGAEGARAVVEAELDLVRVTDSAACVDVKRVVTGETETVCLALYRRERTHCFVILTRKEWKRRAVRV